MVDGSFVSFPVHRSVLLIFLYYCDIISVKFWNFDLKTGIAATFCVASISMIKTSWKMVLRDLIPISLTLWAPFGSF